MAINVIDLTHGLKCFIVFLGHLVLYYIFKFLNYNFDFEVNVINIYIYVYNLILTK